MFALGSIVGGPFVITRGRTGRMRAVIGLVTSVAIVLGALGPGAGSAQAAATGSISGRITSGSGEALGGIHVMVYEPGQPAGTWTYRGDTYTAGDGTYVVPELPTGPYRLALLDDSRTYVTEYYDDARTLETATSIQVVDGQTATGRDAQLTPFGRITGTVRRTDGAALEGIEVEAVVPRQGGGWTPLATDVTSDDGTYDLGGLSTGTYRVTFRDVGHAYLGSYVRESYNNKATTDEADDLFVSEGSVRSGIDAVLERNGILGGTVVNSFGDPIENIHVQAYQDVDPGPDVVWASVHPFTVTGFEGGYAIPLSTGDYRLRFSVRDGQTASYLSEFYDDAASLASAVDVHVTNEQTTTLPEVTLALGGRISGSLSDQSGALIGNMFAVPYRRETVDGQTTWVRQVPQLQGPEEFGAWSAGGLEPGTYRIGFENSSFSQGYLPEFYPDVTTLAEAQDIVVGPEQAVAGKDAVLTATANISGNVTAPPFTSRSYRVEAYSSPDGGATWTLAQTYHGDASTDSYNSGDYTLQGLTPGTYRIKFDEDFPGELATEYYDDVATIGQAQDITVTAGERRVIGDTVLEDEPAPPPPPAETIDNTGSPTVSGAPVVGARLTAGRGTWTPDGLGYSYQWLRNGAPISGATGSTYGVGLADRGRVLSVRVTASKPGVEGVSATSRHTGVVRSVSATQVTATSGRRRVTFAVTVTSTRIAPTGSVVVKRGTRTVATLTLSRGKATRTLVRQSRGTRTYTFRYSGDTRVLGSSTSKRVSIR